jgi:hypothetical protein
MTSLVTRLNPTNFLEEKEKFFQDFSYNPQFTYSEYISPQELIEHGHTNQQHVQLATELLERAYHNRTGTDLENLHGELISDKEATKKTRTFLQMHNLEKRYKIIWSYSFVARTTITDDTIKLRLPSSYRTHSILGMLYHEIGTHALRRINYERQPWFKKKKQYGFGPYLRTEEGLAVLHSYIPEQFRIAHNPALRYVGVDYAQQHSFAETWKFLEQYIEDLDRRWVIVTRFKRGLTDTSQPGGFTKDLVYFEGMIEVWDYLKQHNFDITVPYFGKLAMADADKALKLNPNYEPVLPSFFSINHDQYAEHMMDIGKNNLLETT